MPRELDAREVCAMFALGEAVSAMTPVQGGLSHRLWRVDTTSGAFAVKRFNRDYTNPDYVPSIERAFTLEMRAFDAGIEMPRPVPVALTGRCLAELSDDPAEPSTIRVHEWVDGRAPREGDAALAASVAVLMARIHALEVRCDDTLAETLAVHGVAGWSDLLARAEETGAAWTGEFRNALPAIAELEATVLHARMRDDALLMGHRDADAKNVIIADDGRIMLVDWDAAGPVSPRMEATNHAFTWAGAHDDGIEMREDSIDARIVRAFLSAYYVARGAHFIVERDDFAEMLNGMMHWYAFNVRRALGERLNDASDQQLGERIARQGFRSVQRYLRSIDNWVRIANAS